MHLSFVIFALSVYEVLAHGRKERRKKYTELFSGKCNVHVRIYFRVDAKKWEEWKLWKIKTKENYESSIKAKEKNISPWIKQYILLCQNKSRMQTGLYFQLIAHSLCYSFSILFHFMSLVVKCLLREKTFLVFIFFLLFFFYHPR